jgi:hypothetical protein
MDGTLVDLAIQVGLLEDAFDPKRPQVEQFHDHIVNQCAATVQILIDQGVAVEDLPSRLKRFHGVE